MITHRVEVRRRKFVRGEYIPIVANGINADEIALKLDCEWTGMLVSVIIGDGSGAVEVSYQGEPIVVPESITKTPGTYSLSIVGTSADGETRLVTIRNADAIRVLPSGAVTGGGDGPDDPDNPDVGGTRDYDLLIHKPTINGVTVQGDAPGLDTYGMSLITQDFIDSTCV